MTISSIKSTIVTLFGACTLLLVGCQLGLHLAHVDTTQEQNESFQQTANGNLGISRQKPVLNNARKSESDLHGNINDSDLHGKHPTERKTSSLDDAIQSLVQQLQITSSNISQRQKDQLVQLLRNIQPDSQDELPHAREVEERETIQTCYIQRDESEMCRYSQLCYDGDGLIALVDSPTTRQSRDSGAWVAELSKPLSHSNCYDFRYYEGSSFDFTDCYYMAEYERRYDIPFKARDASIDHPLSFGDKEWGPLGDNFSWRTVHPDIVYGSRSGHRSSNTAKHQPPMCAAPLRQFSNRWAAVDESAIPVSEEWRGRTIALEANSCRDRPENVAQMDSANDDLEIEWLDGSLWWVRLEGGWTGNPFHWGSKVFMLFDAMRSNKTQGGKIAPNPFAKKLDADSLIYQAHERYKLRRERFEASNFTSEHSQDDSVRWSPKELRDLYNTALHATTQNDNYDEIRSRWVNQRMVQYADKHYTEKEWRKNSYYGQVVMGTQWDMPPIDFVSFSGAGVDKRTKPLKHIDELPKWARGSLKLSTPEYTQFLLPPDLARYNKKRWLCSKDAMVTGSKHRLFTGISDAWMFRQYAYQLAQVQRLSHPFHPPRQITYLDRLATRVVLNRNELLEEIYRPGMPVKVINDLGKLTFEQQISLMSETSILIAAHGAALTNAMFLPQHAVVIEIFPYKMHKRTYSNIASMFGLFHLPVQMFDKPPVNPKFTDEHHNLLYQPAFTDRCEKMNRSTIDMLLFYECNMPTKNSDLLIPIDQFRVAMELAVDLTGAFSVDNKIWRDAAMKKGIKFAEEVLKSTPTKRGNNLESPPVDIAAKVRTEEFYFHTPK